jgi:putative addiction module CopG family antidote
MPLALSHETEALIQAKISSGAFGTADDVILAGLRLLDAQEGLRNEILRGVKDIQEGRVETLVDDTDFDRLTDGLLARAQTRTRGGSHA